MWRRAPRSSSETDKFRLRHKMFHIPFCMFKVSKKTQKNPHRTTCQIYSKLTIKIPERHLVLFLLLTLNTFYQINPGWTWETIITDKKFVFSNWEKYIVLWAGDICRAICFHSYSLNIRLRKDKFSKR